MKKVLAWCLVLLMVLGLAACGTEANNAQTTEPAKEAATEEKQTHTYYYVGLNHGHPYWTAVHQGFEYFAEKLGVNVIQAGPDTADYQEMATAMEQAIAKKPDGIICPVFDESILPGLKAAKEAGIPVVAIEGMLESATPYVVSYIGLDNYQCGVQTAQELIAREGESGNVVILGNWGSANTDQKLSGFKDYLADYPGWTILAELEDKAAIETAIEQTKVAFNNYPEMTAIVGLNASSGAGIGSAMDELGKEPGCITAVVHDREVLTLEYVEQGYLTCTLVNKTYSMPSLALLILEGLNTYDWQGQPLSGDNDAAGVNVVPANCYNDLVIVTKDNVEYFKEENIPTYDSPNYQ